MNINLNEPELPDSGSPNQHLRLASDNPAPDAKAEDVEKLSAAVQMATYRLAAVFGDLRWIDREVA